ncbi:methionine biosynthesis protein MetW [Parvibium lacunae]|uniref:Methionine biosynthesis protein MetW n=1 Tax=Parvibium lacunae TaxID=1888893 RepID=A0A368L277_9BURK|nr:methionine biosynthesis protein MetW [Parvibium lacunae]RCS57490.1 methionine biosynthesis protein MetW [Parvibium lacunae]
MQPTLRDNLAFIANWVRPGARVLDLGCGDAALLAYLQNTQGCRGYGLDIADDNIATGVAKGLAVIQWDLNQGLGLFEDNAFDVVLQLESLQAVQAVEMLLREMARVGREVIVSFPNFGYWSHRWQLLLGRMPVSKSLPYQWFDTPNIRCATLSDFPDLARKVGLTVIEQVALHEGKPIHWLPNLRGSVAVFRLRRTDPQ